MAGVEAGREVVARCDGCRGEVPRRYRCILCRRLMCGHCVERTDGPREVWCTDSSGKQPDACRDIARKLSI